MVRNSRASTASAGMTAGVQASKGYFITLYTQCAHLTLLCLCVPSPTRGAVAALAAPPCRHAASLECSCLCVLGQVVV